MDNQRFNSPVEVPMIEHGSGTILSSMAGRDSPAIRALREALRKPAGAVTSTSAPLQQ